MIKHFIEFVKNLPKRYFAISVALCMVFPVVFIFFLVTHKGTEQASEWQNTGISTTTETASTSLTEAFPPISVPKEATTTSVMETPPVEPVVDAVTPTPFTPELLPLSQTPLSVGVFAGTIPELYEFEHRVGAQVDIAATAVHWGNESDFPEAYANLVTGRGSTFFIFWYPMDYTKDASGQSLFHFSEITSGAWDAYIEEFAATAARTEGKIIIAPFEEVNGNWVYWNGATGTYGTTEEYIQAFQYLREKFRNAPNVSFAWVVNQVSVPDTPENAISAYYPGDAYVDIIGINAFNFGSPWLSFDTLVTSALAQVLPYHKPLYITSTASTEDPRKAEWIHDLFVSSYFKNDLLKGFIWFNEHKERDWQIWSDDASMRTFVEHVRALP